MLQLAQSLFPNFVRLAPQFELENVLPPASASEIAALESELGLSLPASYKAFLQCARGFWLMGGSVQFGVQHPFVHTFEPLESMAPAQQAIVKKRGGVWPPPSAGMLCFAEFFMEADGDQVLFDTRNGLVAGEYPIVYYAHEARRPHVRRLAASFSQFMEEFLEYDAFAGEA